MNHIYQNLSYLMKAPFTKLDEELVQNTHVYLREQAEPFDVFSQFENPIGIKIVLLLGKCDLCYFEEAIKAEGREKPVNLH